MGITFGFDAWDLDLVLGRLESVSYQTSSRRRDHGDRLSPGSPYALAAESLFETPSVKCFGGTGSKIREGLNKTSILNSIEQLESKSHCLNH